MKKKRTQKQQPADDIAFEQDSEFQDTDTIALVKKLKQELRECQQERHEYLEGWQRARADLLNAKKEMETRLAAGSGRAVEEIMHDVIPVLDSFDMAMGNREVWEQVDTNWRQGIEHIHSQLLRGLHTHGLEVISPLGQPFDPALHESVGTKRNAAEQHDDGTVVVVHQKGYRLRDKVLRPAKVEIAG